MRLRDLVVPWRDPLRHDDEVHLLHLDHLRRDRSGRGLWADATTICGIVVPPGVLIVASKKPPTCAACVDGHGAVQEATRLLRDAHEKVPA